jgi:ankyrin repeat protein
MDHLDMVKLLIENGADPNARETDGCRCTALDWAIRNGNQEMADFLRSQIK